MARPNLTFENRPLVSVGRKGWWAREEADRSNRNYWGDLEELAAARTRMEKMTIDGPTAVRRDGVIWGTLVKV